MAVDEELKDLLADLCDGVTDLEVSLEEVRMWERLVADHELELAAAKNRLEQARRKHSCNLEVVRCQVNDLEKLVEDDEPSEYPGPDPEGTAVESAVPELPAIDPEKHF